MTTRTHRTPRAVALHGVGGIAGLVITLDALTGFFAAPGFPLGLLTGALALAAWAWFHIEAAGLVPGAARPRVRTAGRVLAVLAALEALGHVVAMGVAASLAEDAAVDDRVGYGWINVLNGVMLPVALLGLLLGLWLASMASRAAEGDPAPTLVPDSPA